MTPLVWVPVSLAVARAGWALADNNRASSYNGLGCVDDVLEKRAAAPMAYRVLVPLLLAKVPKARRTTAYALIHAVGVFLLLWTAATSLGTVPALLLAALLPLTLRYDYWDWVPEMACVAACYGGRFDLALVWAGVSAMSRETAVLLPVVWLCATGNLLGAVWIAALVAPAILAVRLWQGKHARYCAALMAERNGRDVASWLRELSVGNVTLSDMTATVALTALALVAALGLGWPRGVPPVMFLVLGWLFGIASETRVFASALVACAVWVSLC